MKTNVISTLFAMISLVCISLVSTSARADGLSVDSFLGIASEYNDVFFGDYYGRNGDIEGHAAIKGDVDVSSYSFGGWFEERHTGSNVLVVGGNATISGTTVHDGNAYIGGTLSNHSGAVDNSLTVFTNGKKGIGTADDYTPTPGNVYVQDASNFTPKNHHAYQQSFAEAGITELPFDFDIAEQQLRAAASTLSGLEDTVDGGYKPNMGSWIVYEIDLAGLTGLQVVTIDASILNSIKALYVNGGTDTTLIINVVNELNALENAIVNMVEVFIDGKNDTFTADFDGSNILFNVDSSVEQINVSNANINGSFLAVDTHFDVRKGHISGQVFGGSAHTENGGEFHSYYTFDDTHLISNPPVTSNTATPEPATLLVLGLGLVTAPVMRRFRKK